MKALALFSGGLDSMLSIKIISDQNIEVVALYMDTGFGADEKKHETLRRRAAMAGASLKVVDLRNEYLRDVLFNPKYGYGKQFNPCIDCHGYMFKTALNMLESENANFIITGEVVGQRPMSQRRDALFQVKRLADDEDDLVLRPMCAKLLPPTKPEREGWVDREKLLGISGRDRKPQLALAKEFGFVDYETPGGGCLLTIESFAVKIKDYLKFDKEMRDIDVVWLKLGRHLRLPDGAKMIIGRDESDNNELLSHPNDKFEQVKFKASDDIVGAVGFISKNASIADKKLAAKLALAYTKANKEKEFDVFVGADKFKTVPTDKALAQNYFVR